MATTEKPSPIGSIAKLREALAQQSVNDADTAAWILDKSSEDICEERTSWNELCDMAYNLAAGFTTLRNAINVVLAIPPRNCDLYVTAKKAHEAWIYDTDNWDEFGSPKLDIHEWLLAPTKSATKGEQTDDL